MYNCAVSCILAYKLCIKMPYSVFILFYFQIDEFPVNEVVALQPGAGTLGDLLLRIIQSNKSKTREDCKKAIGNAHKVRKIKHVAR